MSKTYKQKNSGRARTVSRSGSPPPSSTPAKSSGMKISKPAWQPKTPAKTVSRKSTESKRAEFDTHAHAEIINANRAVKRATWEYLPGRKNNKLEDTSYRRHVRSGNTEINVIVAGRPSVKVSVVEDGKRQVFGRAALNRMARTGEYKRNLKRR